MLTVKDFDFYNKRVLLRCDFNVPITDAGEVIEDFKIRKTLPTIRFLLEKGAKLILMSHLGDPQGKIVGRLGLKPVFSRLKSDFGAKLIFLIGDYLEIGGREKILGLRPGQAVLLENLRFNPGEMANDKLFAEKLAGLAEIYLNDAFAESHRRCASISAIAGFLPSGAGLLLEQELKALIKIMIDPQKPLAAVIGGAKAEIKTGLIEKMSELADWVLIGGLMEHEIRQKGLKFTYPEKIIYPLDCLENNLDIGPQTIKLFKEKIALARTVFWNGPLGRIEDEKFSNGTKAIAEAVSQNQGLTVVGGGETVSFINKIGLIDKFSHVSTGGGAMLAFLAGEEMPGLTALGL